jgi:hypothetical protein
VVYGPALLGFARVHFADPKRGITHAEEVALLAPFTATAGQEVDWYAGAPAGVEQRDLDGEPAAGAAFGDLPAAAARAKSYAGWGKDLADCLYRTRQLELQRSPALDVVSRPGESAGDFRVRLAQKARERRDAEVAKLREKYGTKAARLQERIRKAAQAKERQEDQASQQKWKTGMSLGATVLGVLFGRKTLSKTNLTKVGTAVRGVGRSLQEGKDVAHAEENLEALQAEEKELNAALEAEVAALEARFDPTAEALETVAIKPKKADIEVRTVLLAWAPRRGGEPAWG